MSSSAPHNKVQGMAKKKQKCPVLWNKEIDKISNAEVWLANQGLSPGHKLGSGVQEQAALGHAVRPQIVQELVVQGQVVQEQAVQE